MTLKRSRSRQHRGLTLIETLVSMSVFVVGLTGIVQMQLVASRSTTMARKLGQATELAQDLVANVALWAYDDPRLTPVETVASSADAAVQARALDTRAAVVSVAANEAHYAEGST